MASFFQDAASRWQPPSQGVLWTIAVIVTALVIGSVSRGTRLLVKKPENRRTRWLSLMSWWVLIGAFAFAVVLGPWGAVALIGLASLLALREYFVMCPIAERGPKLIAYAATLVHYAAIALGWQSVVMTLIPVFVLMALAGGVSLRGKTKGYLLTVGSLWLGIMTTVFFLSHAALVASLPDGTNPVAGAMGWFVLLLLLTETNDIFQAFWGRRFGRRKIAPVVSPNKTWEGFLLGGATTVAVALALAPLLTPLARAVTVSVGRPITLPPFVAAGIVGLAVALSGFVGDLVESSAKRDLGVKDSGSFLPGQGGMLDRVDSLTFAAPVYYYLVLFFTAGEGGSYE